MSKSRRKIGKIGIAGGKNTEFYRIANQKIRAKARHILDILRTGHVEADSLSFPSKHRDVKATDWYEPTDGSYLYPRKELEKIKDSDPEYYRKLKNK